MSSNAYIFFHLRTTEPEIAAAVLLAPSVHFLAPSLKPLPHASAIADRNSSLLRLPSHLITMRHQPIYCSQGYVLHRAHVSFSFLPRPFHALVEKDAYPLKTFIGQRKRVGGWKAERVQRGVLG